ncbi:AroM family protein [Sneathiella chinensis]|uniref:LuxR family transcriptional regulator n=1 Tax=Sneathiella chinensis TaxID=349750 RepID=A0ABQ5U3N8_9PROT|nr:AroM family protein [Sneathiella chinensis]GLQ05904.1 LuxR family transcriptional regulator [Sneathiella chinensis]
MKQTQLKHYGKRDMGHRLVVISAGQTPRGDMVAELKSQLGDLCEIVEYGALDGMAPADITELEPRANEIGIATQLNDGRKIALSENWLRHRILEMCEGRGKSIADLTVIASTGVFDVGTTGEYVIHAQNVLDQFIETLGLSGLRIGLIFPLSAQPRARGLTAMELIGAYAPPGDDKALRNAANQLADCDMIILNSLGYSENDRQVVADHSGQPAIPVRRIVARKIARLYRQSIDPTPEHRLLEGSALSQRRERLTNREKQVFDLVVEGLSNKEIARVLEISHRTVEIHRVRMLTKMGVSTANELMRLIVQNMSRARI